MVRVSTPLIVTLFLCGSAALSPTVLADPPAKTPAKAPAKAAPAKGGAPARRPGGAPASSSKAPAGAGSSAALNSYAGSMRQKMATAWVYPQGKNHVTLTVTVNQDGSVSNLTLESSPKNAEAEQKANDAFNSAQPLQALPSGVEEAKVTGVFDSEADQWNTKAANIAVKIDPTKNAAAPGGDAKGADATPAPEDKK